MDKTLPSVDSIVDVIQDGMTIGIGGWGARRKPMSFVRSLIRSSKKDLTVISYGGPDVGMLCASGKVKRLIFGFVSLDVTPLDPFFRQWRQSGGNVLELDEGMLQWGLRASAMNLPFLPTRVGMFTDVEKYAQFKRVRSPYDTQEEFLAMPALCPDVAIIHAYRSDPYGRVIAGGRDVYFDDLLCKAATKTYVTCDQLEHTLVTEHAKEAQDILAARCFIHGVVESPLGAHPTSCHPAYDWDEKHIKGVYCMAAKKDNGWETYAERFITPLHEEYVKQVKS